MIEEIFKTVNFSSAGGTENMVRELYDIIPESILKKFEWIVSYPPEGYIRGELPSILWIHDNVDDPVFNGLKYKDFKDQFEMIVFVSHTQAQDFRRKFNIKYNKSVVLKNAIHPIEDIDIKKFDKPDKLKICYTSMPHKGLIIVSEVFKALKKEFGEYLDFNIFSNYDVYGEYHKSRNEAFKNIYESLETSGVNYHGGVKRTQIIEHLKSSHIWCLPSVFPETSCISMIEAMSAGNICVCNDYGALPETGSGFAMSYHYNEDINLNAGGFYEALKSTIETFKNNNEAVKNHVSAQKFYIDNTYSWNRRAKEWVVFLNSIVKK